MTSINHTFRPLSCWKSFLRHTRRQKAAVRSLTTYHHSKPASAYPLPPPSSITPSDASHVNKKIKAFPPPPSPASHFKDPVAELHATQIALLDPTGARTQLFSRSNPEAAKVGDVLLVRLKNGDPYAGACINIRRRGVDTGILLRNELTRVGVEMWYKIYSPNVEGIEIVQRREKRARRARLTYLRKPKHDMGSVQGMVMQYMRQRAVLRSGGREDKKGSTGKKGKGRK